MLFDICLHLFQTIIMIENVIRVSIVEDLPEIRETLINKINLMEDLVCISNYSNAEDAIIGLVKDQPEIVLMDIGLPYGNGIDCMLRVKLKCPDISFLMFTVFDNDEKVFNALKAGANGYVLKRDGANGVIKAIRELSVGGVPMSRDIAKKVLHSFHKFGPSNENVEKLTPRQIEILNLLSQGLLYKEIADKLTPSITEGGVKQHINRIYKKLQVNNRTEALNKYLGQNRV